MTSPWNPVYYYVVAMVLAQLEIQIEGPYGWAERLPTWRWDTPGVRKWLGKPVTGYHLWLNLFILLFLHLPMVLGKPTLGQETEILSLYFLLCVCWDFLWFVCNPHFGLKRFKSENVWWFHRWWFGVPMAYFGGIAASAALWILPQSADWTGLALRAEAWGLIFAKFAGLVAATVLLVALRRRPPGPSPADPSHPPRPV